MSFHPEGSYGGKGDDIMSTHFLLEGADRGAYREPSSIKGGLRTFSLIPLCCLLLLTVASRGGGSSTVGPICRMWSSAVVTKMLSGSLRNVGSVQGERRLHELLSEPLTGINSSKSKASVLSSMCKEGYSKGK